MFNGLAYELNEFDRLHISINEFDSLHIYLAYIRRKLYLLKNRFKFLIFIFLKHSVVRVSLREPYNGIYINAPALYHLLIFVFLNLEAVRRYPIAAS
jgi:hypothetical protein